MPPLTRVIQDNWAYLLVSTLIATSFLLIFRNAALYPVVFADEYLYSTTSRLIPLSGVSVPNYLYFSVFRMTNVCHDGFLTCARLFNVIFFILTAPFIYLTATRVTGRGFAFIAAALYLLGPTNSYTAYFMPDSMYAFFFWVFSYACLDLSSATNWPRFLAVGIILGLAALVKPHALFLLPGLVAYFVFIFRRADHGDWARSAGRNIAAFVAGVALMKFGLAYVLAGSSALTFLGQMYGSVAESAKTGFFDKPHLVSDLATNLAGHWLALVMLFCVPLAYALSSLTSRTTWSAEDSPGQRVLIYSVVVIAPLVLIATVFTILVAGTGPYETAARLHMRYYNFALPLLVILAAAAADSPTSDSGQKTRLWAAIFVGVALGYAVLTHFSGYAPGIIDSPEIRGLMKDSRIFVIVGLASGACLAVWAINPNLGAKLYLCAALPIAFAVSSVFLNLEIRGRTKSDVFDRAGIFAKQFLSAEQRDHAVAVGSDMAGLYRVLFHLDSAKATLQAVPEGPLNVGTLRSVADWAVVIGARRIEGPTSFTAEVDGYSLIGLRAPVVDFRQASWPGVVAQSTGLYPAENWGSWSSGAKVSIQFHAPLPRKFLLHLVAHAFGPNIGKPVAVRVGDETKYVSLDGADHEVVVAFDNPRAETSVLIDVPAPSSPKELGLSDDSRMIGIGLVGLRVEPVE